MSIALLIKGAGVFLAMTALAVLFDTPKKYLLHTGMLGAIAGYAYMLCMEYGCGNVLASFLSAVLAAVMANICARIYKTPVTLFLVVGILPMVPGAGMYYTVHFLLEQEQKVASRYMLETMEVAGVIALAIFVVDSIFRVFTLMQSGNEKNRIPDETEEGSLETENVDEKKEQKSLK